MKNKINDNSKGNYVNTSLNEMLKSCEQEQLHLSNAIQSFGVLTAIDQDLNITHVSDNTIKLIDREADKLLGLPIQHLLGEHFHPDKGLPTSLSNRRVAYGIKFANGKQYDVLSSQIENGYLIEIEKSEEAHFNTNQSHLLSRILGLSNSRDEIQVLMQKASELIKEVSGYEKVMIYQFQEDWSGEVVCEIGGEGYFDCYYGLRFPASDIPKIARDLYLKTPYRLIADVNSTTSGIITNSGQSVNLTYADLRSVSPVHIAYLKNMQVGASLSFPIVVNEKLWGLFALHHPTPCYLNLEKRIQCADMAHAFQIALKNDLFKTRMNIIDHSDRKVGEIIHTIDFKASTLSDLTSVESRLLDLVDAKSGAIFHGEQSVLFGEAIDKEIVNKIDQWFLELEDSIYSSDSLSQLIPEASNWSEKVSGVMALRVINQSTKQVLRFYWFRPELPKEINWAGNPEKPVSDQEGQMIISPRLSFAKWTETTSGSSKPWTQSDNMVAMKFRSLVLKIVIR